MIDIRPFETLGTFQNDWLKAHYHFSFSGYRDPARTNWGALRVWNDDTIKPKTGFERHGHKDMEIVTYVRRGAITDRDHLATKAAPTPATSRSCGPAAGFNTRSKTSKTSRRRFFSSAILPNRNRHRPRLGSAGLPEGRPLRLARHVGVRPGQGQGRPAHPPGRSDLGRDPQTRPVGATHLGAGPLPLPGPGAGPLDDQRKIRESA